MGCLYDILLDWLELSNVNLHPQLRLLLKYFLDAYADDLATVTIGPDALRVHQKLADCLSAFCSFTGMQLNVPKTKAIWINPPSAITRCHLTLYDNQWNPTPCPVLSSDLKMLGET